MNYGSIPVVVLPREQQAKLETGQRVRIAEDGAVEIG